MTVPCPLGCGRQVSAEEDEIHYCVTVNAHAGKNREYVGTWDGKAMFYGACHDVVERQLRPYREELIESGMTASVEALDGGDPEHVELVEPTIEISGDSALSGLVEDAAADAAGDCPSCGSEGCPDCDPELASEELPLGWQGIMEHARERALDEAVARMAAPAPSAPATPQTLPEAIALALTGTADPTCEQCGAPAFVSSSGHLYCQALWQLGACDGPCETNVGCWCRGEGCYYCEHRQPVPTEPPACFNCEDRGGCEECDPTIEALSDMVESTLDEIAAGLSGDDLVKLAIAARHIPLPDMERYGHKGPTEPPARIAGHMTCECAMCYSLQPCVDDGEAYVCADRAACTRRQEENRGERAMPNALKALEALIVVLDYARTSMHPHREVHRFLFGSDARHPEHAILTQARAAVQEAHKNAPVCPSCGDPSVSLCPACRESGEGRPAALAQMTAAALDTIAI